MIYKPSQSEQAHIFLDKCFERKRHVRIDFIPETKTLSQLRYIWLVFTIIADDADLTKDDVYEYYRTKFQTTKIIELHGKDVIISKSMSRFLKEEMSFFIDKVVIDARQEGHVIPDSGDIEALQAYDYYRQKGML